MSSSLSINGWSSLKTYTHKSHYTDWEVCIYILGIYVGGLYRINQRTANLIVVQLMLLEEKMKIKNKFRMLVWAIVQKKFY